MSAPSRRARHVPTLAEHPPVAEIEAEALAWYEFADLVRSLRPGERLQPGYYRDPDWSVRDLAAHVGTWLAEAAVQFQRMLAGTYEGHEVDVDALNAALLEAVVDQPWTVIWTQANAARTTMREAWFSLGEDTTETEWWLAKSGAPHYEEHLARLRDWAAELHGQRGR